MAQQNLHFDESDSKTLIDKAVILVLAGLGLVGGWSVLGLIFAGLHNLAQVL